ncbi:MAG TPA: D-2-hydroxyacid dehydrogenase, partial [Limnochordia bacterium]
MARIVVLDGYTLNPGDLSWEPLEAIAPTIVYPRTPPEEVAKRAKGAEIVLTNKAIVDRRAIEALPELRYIGVLATGYNVVDVEAARARGVIVTNVPGYGAPAVAQATFALLLELTNHVGLHSAGVREGKWTRSPDWSYWERPLVELSGLTMGIIGFGAIGQAVARIAAAFGMKVIVHTRTPRPEADVAFTSLEEIFPLADVLSLHCPLTPATQGLVSAERLRRMKPTAFLLNTARGPLVDEAALADALNHDRLAGAGLDVLSVEPPPETNPLLRAKNCLITPHHAWAT